MASEEETTPLTCSICLENKDKKSPRILPCHHSFCQECLQSWHSKRTLQGLDRGSFTECPICRKKANIPPGGIEELPMDFRVQEFASFLHVKSNIQACQACDRKGNVKPAEASCKTCYMRFCLDCSKSHTEMPLFADHEIMRAFCDIHGSALEYVCVTCCSGACVHCVYSSSHNDHDILKTDAGIKSVQTKMMNIMSELQSIISACDAEIESKLQVCFDKQCDSEERIRKAGDMIKQAVDTLVEETLQQHKIQHKAAVKGAFDMYIEESTKNTLTKDEIKDLFEKDNSDILRNLRKVFVSAERAINYEKELHLLLSEPSLMSVDCCRLQGVDEVMEALKKCSFVCGVSSALSKSRDSLAPVLLSNVKCDQNPSLASPWNVSVTSEGDAVVCNYTGGIVHKIYKNGRLEVLPGTEGVATTCEENGNIYVVSKEGNTVTKVSREHPHEIMSLNPPVPNSRGFAIRNDKAFSCSGKNVVKYCLTDCSGNNILDIKSSGSLTYASAGGSSILVITDDGSHEVIICDLDGRELRRFGEKGSGNGQLDSPKGVQRIANGNFIIADWENNRIVEYEANGKFVRNILTSEHGLDSPSDVGYLHPYLWVTEHADYPDHTEGSVKLFLYN